MRYANIDGESLRRKTIVCLAKSYKHSNFCVAGKEILPNGDIGAWIRPVHPLYDSVPAQDFPYKVGDIISLDLACRQKDSWQRENHVLAERINARHEGRASRVDLTRYVDTPATIWGVGESSGEGVNDRVPEDQARRFDHTLLFIFLKRIVIWQKQASWNDSTKLRLNFIHKQNKYSIAITDPLVLEKYNSRLNSNESAQLTDCYITMSLGLPFHGNCYKLAASIIHV